jgi:sulfatase maturation enzyme AslB (radical SAM superfamily)
MPIFYNLLPLIRRKIPGQLVIQLTDRCNARCPQCGMRTSEPFKRTTLSLDDVKRTLDAAPEKGIRVVSFTGGEPLLMIDELVALIKYAAAAGIEYIRTGTNGFYFARPDRPSFQLRVNKLAEKLAGTPLRNLWISIDSLDPETHETMRGFKDVIQGIEMALPVLHAHGIFPSANLGVNRNVGGDTTRQCIQTAHMSDTQYIDRFHETYLEAFDKFFRFIINLGFTMASICYPMSIDDDANQKGLEAVYAATSTDSIVHYSTAEKAALFRALLDTVPNFRSQVRIFSPLCSLKSLLDQYQQIGPQPYPCRGGLDFFFINAKDGNTYPCGYRGNNNFGKLWNLSDNHLDLDCKCFACDWECFRDPSELFGPFLQAFSTPFKLLAKIKADPRRFHYWFNDLRYYWACNFFDGREPLSPDRLQAFASNGLRTNSNVNVVFKAR